MSEKKTSENYFAELAKIDVSGYTEKKGQFTYLSWAWAVDQLRRKYPDATWEVKKFTDQNGNTMPYMITPGGAFVEIEVTVQGMSLSQIHPVLDFKNKAVTNPNAFDVNKAIQRGLVKAIALHGLGLYIYAGEDMPQVPVEPINDMQKATLDSKVETFAKMRGRTPSEVYQALRVPNIDQLTEDQAQQVIDVVAHWIKKAEEEDAEKQDAANE